MLNRLAKLELMCFIFLICLVLGSVCPSKCFGGKLEIGDGFFYGDQYEKAISSYMEALGESIYDTRTKTNIKYKIGLSYYLLQVYDKALQYWTDAKRENPGIYDGKIYRIPSGGMEPQLITGDHILVDNEYYKHKRIERGHVVVFLNPSDSKNLLIKRVIGLPGDKIEIKKKVVFINDTKLFDKFAQFEDKVFFSKRDNFGPIVVPEKCYFLLGDNRDKTLDSRFIGSVPDTLIIGKALAIYGSFPNKYSVEGAVTNRIGMIIQ